MTHQTPDDFSNEIDAHLAHAVDDLIARGVSPDEARLAARRQFGSTALARERFYESGRWLWLDRARQDFRGAVRSLLRYPVATLVAVISLGVGIGAMAATLIVRNIVFRDPPPLYQQPQQLSLVRVVSPDRPIYSRFGPCCAGAVYDWWRANETTAGSIAAATMSAPLDVRTDDTQATVRVRRATRQLFSILGVPAAMGRTFAELPSDSASPAILSHRQWQSLFGSRPDVVGQSIWIDDRPYVVAGVMPRAFWFTAQDSPIWTLMDDADVAAAPSVQVIVRRPDGVSADTLVRQLQSSLTEYAKTRPAAERQLRVLTMALQGTPIGDNVSLLLPYVLAVSVVLTLVLACANVAILLIAQWATREHEIAIRASLGASRGRIVRALLTESVLLAIAGGALGICATFALRGIFVYQSGAATSVLQGAIDPRVLAQSIAIVLISGLAIGLAPALYETRKLHTNPLVHIAASDRSRQRWRHALVVLEVTITIALLVETGGMIVGYRRELANDNGFRAAPLLSLRVQNRDGVPIGRVLDSLDHLPGVAHASAGTVVPLSTPFGPQKSVSSDATGSQAILAERAEISERFFETLDVPVRSGRAFTSVDAPQSKTAIVNETVAARLFPGGAVGNVAWIDGVPHQIVGVVANYSHNPFQDRSTPKVFVPLPLGRTPATQLEFLIRAQADAARLVETARREARKAAPGNVVANAFTLQSIVDLGSQEMLVGAAPLFPLITIGLLLTAAGVYGVLAFATARRSREFAIRLALGATGGHLARIVITHSARIVMAGAALGVAITFGLSRVVRAAGAAGSIYDPPLIVFVLAIVTVAVVAAIAAWIPSRRALTVDPADTLRCT